MAKVAAYFVKLRKKWGVSSLWQFVLIMLVFALTGSSILIVKSWIFSLLGIGSDLPVFYSILLFIAITLPTYHILLLFYGVLLGQFTFFWNFEKRFFTRLTKLFRKRNG